MTSRSPLPAPGLPEVTALLDCFPDPAILLALDYRIIAANGAYRKSYGDSEPLHARHCYEVSHHYRHPCDQAGESCPLKHSLESGQPHRVLHLHYTPRGQEHVDVETFPIRDDEGNIIYFMEVLRHARLASSRPQEHGLVGRSRAFNQMLELIQRVAPSEAAVLVLGESGTGKELVAQAIHEASRRAKGPFVAVEGSGLSETLFESELFGHEKGAFTGAHTRKTGLVEVARGGTLFLDELGDIPLGLQVKLLRLLETGTYRRVGGVEPLKADFRLLCATHRDLKAMVSEAGFRQDLYYRVSTFPIRLPPLRERIEDLPLLVETLLRRVDARRDLKIHADALACLEGYGFPGNIRELRNILERASLLADGDTILMEHLPEECHDMAANRHGLPVRDEIVPLDAVERRYLQWAVMRFAGDNRALAQRLGISERTLYRKLSELKSEASAGAAPNP